MTKREFLDIVFALAPTEANAIMDAFDEYVESNEPHWIPVANGLPNIREDVLVSSYDEVMTGWLNNDETWFAEGIGRLNMNDVSAWMPLPEPFKGVTSIPSECKGDCGWCKPSVIEECKGMTK